MSSSTFVEMHTLPPTADSAMFHIYRTFYLLKEWMAEGEFEFTDWGWAVEKGGCVPVRSSLPLRQKSF